MKLRNAKPSSISIATKSVLVFISLLMVTVPTITVFNNMNAYAICSSVSSCQQEQEYYEGEAAKLASQAKTLESALSELQYQADALSAQIGITQAKYDDLNKQIIKTEQKIKDNQDALGTVIADMYVDDKISPIEMLASSKNIGDYMDKQEYKASIRSQISSTINSIKKLKTSLDSQKSDVELVLIDQRNARSELDRKNQEKQDLLAKTNGDEGIYRQLAANAGAEGDKILAAQRAWNSSLIGTYSDYSQIWNNSNCRMGSQYDPDILGYYSWGGSNGNGGDGHSYGCRQCVSYAIWRVYQATGHNYATEHIYENWGDPVQLAASASGVFNSGSTPRANSLGIMSAQVAGNDGQGHVVWVESVNNDGTLTVSQYNANINGIGYGMYSKAIVSASKFYEYVYIVN